MAILLYNLGMAGPEQESNAAQEALTKQLQEEMSLRDQMAREFHPTELDEFRVGLGELRTARSEEDRERVRERIYEHFGDLTKQELGHLDFIADRHMSGEFAFPYDSRQGAVWFMVMRREIDEILSVEPEKGGFDGESRKWLETLYDAVAWGDGQYSIQEGLNMIQWYYGGLDAMGYGLPNMKLRIKSSNFIDAYARDIRGNGSTKASCTGLLVRKGAATDTKSETTKVWDPRTRQTVDKQVNYIVRAREEVENMRETGVDYHDDFFYWRTMVAATAQYDYANPTKEGLVNNTVLRRELEVEFITRLFGSKDRNGNLQTVTWNGMEVPKSILNFYTMKDTDHNRKEYAHLMQALMQVRAREDLVKVISEDGMQALVQKVMKAKGEIELRDKERKLTFKDRISGLVVKQGITFDVGSANSGPMAWQWDYVKDRQGKVIRKVSFGGINQAGDWYTPEFPFAHNFVYDIRANKRSGLILPTSDAYRKRQLREKSPLEKPQYSLEEAKLFDPMAYNEAMKVVADDDVPIVIAETDKKEPITMLAGEWRKANRFQISKDVRLALKDMLWFQEVPYPDENGKNQLFATFMPHRYKLSFLDQAVLKTGSNGENLAAWRTIGDDLRGGKKLSEVNWGSDIKEYQWDWWLVNLNMAERWARFLAEPGDPRRSEELFGGIGTLKELLKRGYLGSRGWFFNVQDSPETPETARAVGPVVMILAIAGQLPILNASKANERGGLSNDLISHDIATTSHQHDWENLLTDWLFMAKYMPPDMDETEGNPEFFNQTLALVMAVTGSNLYEIALRGGTNELWDKVKAKTELRTMLANSNRLVVRNSANLKK
jgi:hypothetical protein